MMTMSCPSIPQRRKMDCVSTVVDQDQVEPSAFSCRRDGDSGDVTHPQTQEHEDIGPRRPVQHADSNGSTAGIGIGQNAVSGCRLD